MTDRHEHLDEGTIHAWLDGALPPDESARVEAQSASCAECAALVAEARGLVAASSRILSSLDAVPAGVIPGSSGSIDQLAALRARHGSRKRHWWTDRRIVAAASVVFVAGVSTMVWRVAPESARSPIAEQMADGVQPLSDSVSPTATAPTAPAPPANDMANESSLAREAQGRGAGAAADRPASPFVASPVDAARTIDTTQEQKVAAATSLSRQAANQARLADSVGVDPTRQAEARREVSERVAPVQQSAQQQGQVGKQQGFQQMRPDTMRVTAPPPSFGTRARMAPAVGRASADAASAPACYSLQSAPLVVDSIRLFNEMIPQRSDPSWFRAENFGRSMANTPLQWRQVDSVTIELRVRSTDATGVRFTTNNTLPDVRREDGLTGVTARRIICP